jgi:hypothetical protein
MTDGVNYLRFQMDLSPPGSGAGGNIFCGLGAFVGKEKPVSDAGVKQNDGYRYAQPILRAAGYSPKFIRLM